MRQVTQSLDDGMVRIVDVPVPGIGPHDVLVRNAYSLISAGTERSKIELGRASMLEKVRRRPDDVKKVLNRVRRDGLLSTYRMVRTRLEQDSPLGYSTAGVVLEVGELVPGIRPGDRVACGGAGYANHADVVAVPGNLCAPVPPSVPLSDAAYATVGAIAMQGFRQSGVGVGDWVAVIGMGLLGQITAAICRAAGCRVIGTDVDERKLDLASRCGVEVTVRTGVDDIAAAVRTQTGGLGVDAVIITAATHDNAPVVTAGEIARDRGVVVVVGAVPIDVPRSPYYEKELTVRLSRSYGPGRYDAAYEEYGIDYPVGYVKWTERRNMEEFLRLASAGAFDFEALRTHRFDIERAAEAYDAIVSGDGFVVGALLEYGTEETAASEDVPARTRGTRTRERVGLGLVGAGNFATATLLPALAATGEVDLVGVATAGGLSAGDVARRFGFDYTAADASELLKDEGIDALMVVTRHDSHAELVADALSAGRTVFVEKPLAVSAQELSVVTEAYRRSDSAEVLVGFNRRFAPFVRALRQDLERIMAPRQIVIRVNAGALPDSHWTKRIESGGGRIVGELCHFIDLACHLAGASVTSVQAVAIDDGSAPALCDSLAVILGFENGSIASLAYTAAGDPAAGKELIEVHSGGRSWIIDDFVTLTRVDGGRVTKESTKQDKGHRAEMAEFVRIARGSTSSVLPFSDAVHSTIATLAVVESLCTGGTVTPESPGRLT
jgi:predicted dehydrogenase